MKLPEDNQKPKWLYVFVVVAFILVAFASLLIGLGVGVLARADVLSRLERVMPFGGAVAQEPKQVTTPQGLPDFVALAKKLKPEVVNISTTQTTKEMEVPNPFGQNDPFNEFWRRFFGAPFPHGQFKQRSLGSGFIIR